MQLNETLYFAVGKQGPNKQTGGICRVLQLRAGCLHNAHFWTCLRRLTKCLLNKHEDPSSILTSWNTRYRNTAL